MRTCAGHAHYELPASTACNAVIAGRGLLRISDPPSQRLAIARPDWVKRYPGVDAYIRPFTPRGRLRRGLTLHGTPTAVQACGVGTARATKLTRVMGYTCFARKLPLRSGDRIACPDAPGSKRFRRGYAIG